MSEPNFPNRSLYHGDNLDFLRGMNSETVDLIATDPPFNKSRDFHATPDSLAAGSSFQDRWSWRDDIHDDWLIKIQRDSPEVWHVINAAKNVYGYDMGAFICWLGVRLLEMRRVLKPTGSIYLHIDHTAHAWVKALMDAVFGKANFRNEIVWRIGWISGFKSQKRGWIRNHETLLYYVKTASGIKQFNKEYIPYTADYVRRDGKRPTGKGIPMEDTWNCSSADVLDSIMIKSFSTEKTGYPTQKPLALYERIIRASSNPGDMVLDPFCGCATTPVAAERLGRQWVGMDIWDKAYQMVLDRLESEGLAVPYEDDDRYSTHLITFGSVHYSTTPPVRTDGGEEAVLYLQTPTARAKRYPPPRSQHEKLLGHIGPYCQGCGRYYGFDVRVLEVDHIRPKSDGGSDAYDNLTLLCPPCNREKRDRMTLTGLQDHNRRFRYLSQENEANIQHGRARASRRRRR